MSKFRHKDPKSLQADLWIQPGELTKGPKDGFYAKLLDVLDGMDFTGQIHRLCGPHYKAGLLSPGRPPTDPAVLFKMLMLGFWRESAVTGAPPHAARTRSSSAAFWVMRSRRRRRITPASRSSGSACRERSSRRRTRWCWTDCALTAC